MTRSVSRPLAVAALLAAATFAAQATVYVEAASTSLAQGGVQPATSYARIVNGVPVPGWNYAAPNGSSSVGGNVHAVWADTTQIDGPALATAYASASLAEGSLRAYSEAGAGGATIGLSYARWTDTITFNNVSGQVLELDFHWQTEGSITPMRAESGRYVTSSIQLGVNNQHFSFISLKDQPGGGLGGAQYNYYGVDANGGGYFSFQPRGNNDGGQWRTTFTGPESGLLSATLLVPEGLASIDIVALISVDCRVGAICDFGHTASFAFGALAPGLSWTSESGVFLSAPVPEPSTWALLALGLAATAAVVRRRARRARA